MIDGGQSVWIIILCGFGAIKITLPVGTIHQNRKMSSFLTAEMKDRSTYTWLVGNGLDNSSTYLGSPLSLQAWAVS